MKFSRHLQPIPPPFVNITYFGFKAPIVILKFQMARAVNFFEFEIFDVRFGISVQKDIKIGGVAIALPKKMVITTRPTIATARGTKLKSVQHSLVFCE